MRGGGGSRYKDRLAHFSKLLDLSDTVIDDLRVLLLKVFSELGDIVDLDLVPQTRLFLQT